ncbi:putative glutathione peroxidase [Helianthus anomalus]
MCVSERPYLCFEILAFPCNQFLQQEPGTIEETVQFVCERFKAEYPIFAKVKVNGSNTEPLYKYLKANGGGLMGTTIKWNFTKFLINKKGEVIRRYGARTEPSSIEVIQLLTRVFICWGFGFLGLT